MPLATRSTTRSSQAPETFPPAPPAPTPSRGITPPIDWQAGMEATARRLVEEEARQARQGEPLDSKPPLLEKADRRDEGGKGGV